MAAGGKGDGMVPGLLLIMLLWPLAGLAASPVPTGIYTEVDHGLRPAVVLGDPEAYRGRTVLIGGMVERTVSEYGQVTVELTGYRLHDDDRPEVPDPALGRIVVAGANLDGARLQPGRLVTVVGTVSGLAPAGTLPLLAARFVHPWPTDAEAAAAREAARMRSCRDSCWCDPWRRDPWCDPWYFGPYPRWHFGLGYHRHRH